MNLGSSPKKYSLALYSHPTLCSHYDYIMHAYTNYIYLHPDYFHSQDQEHNNYELKNTSKHYLVSRLWGQSIMMLIHPNHPPPAIFCVHIEHFQGAILTLINVRKQLSPCIPGEDNISKTKNSYDSSQGGVLPERYPTMSNRFSTYRGVILSLLHVHAIGVFKLSWFGKVQ